MNQLCVFLVFSRVYIVINVLLLRCMCVSELPFLFDSNTHRTATSPRSALLVPRYFARIRSEMLGLVRPFGAGYYFMGTSKARVPHSRVEKEIQEVSLVKAFYGMYGRFGST